MATSVVNSKFLFIEFAPEALAGLIMYDKIEVGNCWYHLKSLVRCYQSHFTCGIVNDQKWLYFDDLLQTVREFPSLEAMQRHIPGGWFFAVFELNGHSSSTNKIEMPVSQDYEMSQKFDSFNINVKSPHKTKLESNVGDERRNANFSTQFQTNTDLNARHKTKRKLVWSKSVEGKRQKLELGQGDSGAALPNKVTATSTKSHFINSVFVQPGVYSCAIDCLLEGSRYLFLPDLSELTARSQFPELLFAAAPDYQNQGGNPSILLV